MPKRITRDMRITYALATLADRGVYTYADLALGIDYGLTRTRLYVGEMVAAGIVEVVGKWRVTPGSGSPRLLLRLAGGNG